MSLQLPKLDDRTFQQIVDELKQRIHLYTPEWTDHNVSDPGVTLIELFAWAIDQLIYRLNRVPELHYIAFLKFLGIHIPTPRPARAELVFRLSAPQAGIVPIPAGTQVSTTQTENGELTFFTVTEECKIFPADYDIVVQQLAASSNVTNQSMNWHWRSIENRELEQLQRGYDPLDIFTKQPPKDNEAFYVGFSQDLSKHILCFELECKRDEGAGILSTNPPWSWEVSSDVEGAWVPCDPESVYDETRGFNQSGRIEITLPQMGKSRLSFATQNSAGRFWLRVRLRSGLEIKEQTLKRQTMKPYERSPQILQIKNIGVVGRITEADSFHEIRDDILGVSSGEPGQRFTLRAFPVLERNDNEYLVVENPDGSIDNWHEIDSFAYYDKAKPRGYVLDAATGEVRFPPYLRQEDGTIQEYGEIPARGATIRFRKYRAHGSEGRNNSSGQSFTHFEARQLVKALPPRAVNQLRTSIPYIDSVENRKPTRAAQSLPDIEVLSLRVLSELRVRNRAVTLEDYALLVKSEFSDQIEHIYPVFEEISDDELPASLGEIESEFISWARKNQKPKEEIDALENNFERLKVYIKRLARTMRVYIAVKEAMVDEKVNPNQSLITRIETFLNERQLIGMRPVQVRHLRIRSVSLYIEITVTEEGSKHTKQIEETVKGILSRYIDPFKGGKDGQGWKPGEAILVEEIRSIIQRHSGILRMLKLTDSKEEQAIRVQQRIENAATRGILTNVDIPDDGIETGAGEIFKSGEHEVKVTTQRSRDR